MKFHISATGIKKVTISNSGVGVGKGGGGGAAATTRRVPSRSALLVLLLIAIFLPFIFVRIAFLILESASACDSPLDCMGLRLFSGGDTSLKVGEELTRALVEDADGDGDGNERGNVGSLESFDELVKEMTLNRRDIKAFASMTKKMLMKMERKVQSAKQHELIYWHLASHGIPKSLHCLALRLTEEYSVNAMARTRLPSPEFVSRLTDPSFHHVVLLTDNVLAASVVISSTLQNAINPHKFVFHIVTDKKTYTPMHTWFALNSVSSRVVEVKGLHQFDWSQEVNIRVKEMLEIHRLIWRQHYENLKDDFGSIEGHEQSLQALSPSCLSLLNHLRIYIHKLFPDLNKIVLLDDDVVVQRDISSLWEMDLNGKVLGAVVDSWCGDNCCPGRKYKDYFDFSHHMISSNLNPDHCAWLSGMNVIDLKAWRQTNITEAYSTWLRLSLGSGLQLWQPGAQAPALLAFKGLVHDLDPSWHVAGLGSRSMQVPKEKLESAAVLHFSGPAKPWLEISSPEVRNLWYKQVNSSDSFVKKCKVLS